MNLMCENGKSYTEVYEQHMYLKRERAKEERKRERANERERE